MCPDRSRAMIAAGAFVLLKTGRKASETGKQAEIRLMGFATILAIWRSGRPGRGDGRSRSEAANNKKDANFSCNDVKFCGIWLMGRIAHFCYPDHSIGPENDAVSCRRMPKRDVLRFEA
jgi:hypothetical protein